MDKSIAKKLVIPFIVFLGFVAINVNSLANGIANHQTWRIVVAGVSLVFFLIAIKYILKTTFRKRS
jgi:protein-S-isoprenylcysteine O-methyltransferase Ste14